MQLNTGLILALTFDVAVWVLILALIVALT